MPPNASPNAQTTRPQPTLVSPASLDHGPRRAVISQTPIPIWIQTAAAPAWIGWYDQLVPAQFTRCWTQPGEAAAAGWMTCEGSPTAMDGWACSRPSKIQMMPKPIRSSWRQPGSAMASPRPAAPLAGGRIHSLIAAQATARITKTQPAMIPWCSSALRNAATRVGLSLFRPEFMPGIVAHRSSGRRPCGCAGTAPGG